MKNIAIRIPGLLLAGFVTLLAASCGKESVVPVPEEETVCVEFGLGTGSRVPAYTRLTGVTLSEERTVSRWALYIFKSDGSLATPVEVVTSSGGTNAGDRTVQKVLGVGTYQVWAVCNYATSGNAAFTPSGVSTLSALQAKTLSLVGNSRSNLLMAGGAEMTFDASTTGTQSIPVARLVCKSGAERVTVNMSEDYWKTKTFVLKGMYLTNVNTVTKIGSDYSSASNLDWTQGRWYNTMGWHRSNYGYYNGSGNSSGSNSGLDALTGETSINATISGNGGVHSTAHYFYFYPNPVTASQDHRSTTWGSGTNRYRRTRLVLECTFDGTTCYYTVSLPESTRNNTYIASNVTISKPGSLDPEFEDPDAVTVVWSTDTQGWEGPVNVSEDS